MTQQQFAESLEKKPGVVSAWETGKSLPDLDSVATVCIVLNVEPDVLLRDAGFSLIPNAARASHALPPDRILIAPEGSMSDPTFRQVWSQVTVIWKKRKERPKKWKALTSNLDSWTEDLGEPEPLVLTDQGWTERQPDSELRQVDISTGVLASGQSPRASGKARKKR